MSADPFVQAPYNSQSYNRYSYVFNNPLSFTDPSGYECVSYTTRDDESGQTKSGTSGDCTSYTGMDAYYYGMDWLNSQYRQNYTQQSFSGNPGTLGGWGTITGSANFLMPVVDACAGDSACIKTGLNELAKGQLAVLGLVGGEGLVLAKLANGVKNTANANKAGEALSQLPKIKWGAQEKHFPGHNSYTPGRSTLTSNPTKLAEKAGTGEQVGKLPVGSPGSKERIDFGEKIGTYIDPLGGSSPTTKGLIHYSNDGIHIVPARP